MKSPLPPRLPKSHKGDYGHVLIIGGDLGMGGAACLSAEAALRIGAGLVTVVTRSEHLSALLARCPELMCYGTSDDMDSIKIISELLEKATVCVIGPGFGNGPWSKKVFDCVFQQKKLPTLPYVIDGGALRLLAKMSLSCDYCNHWVLTPHPGEAGCLLNCSVADVQKNREKSVRELQQKWGGVIVLKGAGTLVCDDGSTCMYKNDAENPAMATAGMGDVLSGIIGGLIAQGGGINGRRIVWCVVTCSRCRVGFKRNVHIRKSPESIST